MCYVSAPLRAEDKAVSIVPHDRNAQNVRIPKPPPAQVGEETLGAYSVVDHSTCNRRKLPCASGDALGWINNRASWQQFKFVEENADVRADDFLTPGNAGVDSVALAYVSSHGLLDGNSFILGVGGAGGSCTVTSNQMKLGDSKLRYLFLSACESVVASESGKIWLPRAKGLRAVFGYGTNIQDSDLYGSYFFENWKKTGARTTDAFLEASLRVSHTQVPVAAWFGPAAEQLRDNEEYFQTDEVVGNFIAWKGYKNQSLFEGARLLQARDTVLRFGRPPRTIDVLAVVAGLTLNGPSDERYEMAADGHNLCYRFADGTVLVFNTRSGSLDLTLPNFRCSRAVAFTNAWAAAAATAHVLGIADRLPAWRAQFRGVSLALVPAALRHTVAGTANRAGKTVERQRTHVTVVFRPSINGVTTIGTGGVLEVTLNGDRAVCRVRSVLPRVIDVSQKGRVFEVEALRRRAEQLAVAEVGAERFVKKGPRVLESELGYYLADENVARKAARLSFRVLVELRTGEFARRVEKVYDAIEIARAAAAPRPAP